MINPTGLIKYKNAYINPDSISSFEEVKDEEQTQTIVRYNMCDSFGIITSTLLEDVSAADFENAFKTAKKTGETVNLLA